MSLETLSNIFLFGIVGVAGTVALVLFALAATTVGGGKITFKLPSFAATSKRNLIAIPGIAVGILVLWICWDIISAFPAMSALEKSVVLAVIVFTVMASYGLWEYFKAGDSVWPKRFASFSVAVILAFGAATYFYGERFIEDPMAQEAFVVMQGQDPRGLPGDPLYMGHQTNTGKWVRSTNPLTGELFHPSECRPKGVPHRGFDYSKDGLCVSPTNGVTKLVPWETKHSPAVPNLSPFKTPAEREAEAAAKQAAADAKFQRQLELTRARNPAPLPTHPAGAPLLKVVPACGDGTWVEVAIPSGWIINLPWNTAAATYEWRDSATGRWIKKPEGSVDKVRFCAKHENYAGDEMLITWTRA